MQEDVVDEAGHDDHAPTGDAVVRINLLFSTKKNVPFKSFFHPKALEIMLTFFVLVTDIICVNHYITLPPPLLVRLYSFLFEIVPLYIDPIIVSPVHQYLFAIMQHFQSVSALYLEESN